MRSKKTRHRACQAHGKAALHIHCRDQAAGGRNGGIEWSVGASILRNDAYASASITGPDKADKAGSNTLPHIAPQ